MTRRGLVPAKTQLIRRAAPKKTPGTDADIERHNSDAAPCGVGKAPWAAQKGSTGCAVGGWRKKGGGRAVGGRRQTTNLDRIGIPSPELITKSGSLSTTLQRVWLAWRPDGGRKPFVHAPIFPPRLFVHVLSLGVGLGFPGIFGMHVASPGVRGGGVGECPVAPCYSVFARL